MAHPFSDSGAGPASPARRRRDRASRQRLLDDLGRLALKAGRIPRLVDSRSVSSTGPSPVRSLEAESLRRHVAGELHDGVLQVLTAIAVRLDAASMMLDSRPDDARELIAEICRSVRAEQRELRMFVDELKGKEEKSVGGKIPMQARVRAMLDRVETMWGVTCTLVCRGDLPADMNLGRTVLRLVQEATVNAIRHGNANVIRVRVRRSGDKLRLVVSDNGCGFTFDGDLDHDVLVASKLGPVLLKRRVIEAGGRLRILTGGEGTHICMCVPAGRTDRPVVH